MELSTTAALWLFSAVASAPVHAAEIPYMKEKKEMSVLVSMGCGTPWIDPWRPGHLLNDQQFGRTLLGGLPTNTAALKAMSGVVLCAALHAVNKLPQQIMMGLWQHSFCGAPPPPLPRTQSPFLPKNPMFTSTGAVSANKS